MINRELQTSQREKQEILAFEGHLAAASTKQTITESSSLLLSQLTSLDPQYVLLTSRGQARAGSGGVGGQGPWDSLRGWVHSTTGEAEGPLGLCGGCLRWDTGSPPALTCCCYSGTLRTHGFLTRSCSLGSSEDPLGGLPPTSWTK